MSTICTLGRGLGPELDEALTALIEDAYCCMGSVEVGAHACTCSARTGRTRADWTPGLLCAGWITRHAADQHVAQEERT